MCEATKDVCFNSLGLVLSGVFVVRLLVRLCVLTFGTTIFRRFYIFRSRYSRSTTTAKEVTTYSIQTMGPSTITRRFRTHHFLRGSILGRFKVTAIRRRHSTITIFHRLSSGLFSGKAQMQEVRPCAPFPFRKRSIRIPIVRSFNNQPRQASENTEIGIRPTWHFRRLLQNMPFIQQTS